MNYIDDVMFMPGYTIDAVLKLHNSHAMSLDELYLLREEFNTVNSNVIPRPYHKYIIPILPKYSTK